MRIARPSSRNAEVEPVLGAVGSESAQNRRRQQPARLDRQRDSMSGRCSAISVQSIDPENSASMCVYAWPAPGLNRCRSYQLLMLGISSIPSRCARPKIGADWPCVSGPSRSTSKPASSRPNPSRQCRDRRRLEADLEGEHRVSRVMLARGVERVPLAHHRHFRGATRNAFFSFKPDG